MRTATHDSEDFEEQVNDYVVQLLQLNGFRSTIKGAEELVDSYTVSTDNLGKIYDYLLETQDHSFMELFDDFLEKNDIEV